VLGKRLRTAVELLKETQDFIGRTRCSCVLNEHLLVTSECPRCELLRKHEDLIGPQWFE
jgi:hypothetical protein